MNPLYGQVVNLFASALLLLAFASRIERRIWPFVATGILSLVCVAGIMLTADAWVVVFAAGLGFAAGFGFALALTLPPLLSAPDDVARTAAAMFTISYSLGVIISVLGGAVWDLAGAPRFAFLPTAVGILPLVLLSASIR